MDPEVTLADILRMVREYQLGNRDIDLDLLIEQIDSLDTWLNTKGFLPKRWSKR